MAMDTVPWFIGGGAEHSPAVARLVAYTATNGATGITTSTDLQVRALGTPGAAIQVMPGSGVALSRYTGASQQSYMVRNASATQVAIPATGSGAGATRYIIVKVTDPEFEGQPPVDVKGGPYVDVRYVSSITNLAYPFIPLAKIVQPASTATITQAMITDLREVANPRTLDVQRVNPMITAETETLTATAANGEQFPGVAEQTISIPAWATRVQIECSWLGVRYAASQNPNGECWFEWGPYVATSNREYDGQHFAFNADASADVRRINWIAADDMAVPAAVRGTDQIFMMKAKLEAGSSGASMDGGSGIIWRVRFMELADPSTS